MSRISELWAGLKESERRSPSMVVIDAQHVEGAVDPPSAFRQNEHYFRVVVNEMFLRVGREWLVEYDPMVFAVSEFAYDGKLEGVPFVVGPALLEKYGKAIPGEGMLFSETTVAGLHPYRGAGLTLTLILYRVQRRNYAREVLRVVEGAAGALDFATSLASYTKVAGVVLGGIEALVGFQETQPLVGYRDELGKGGKPLLPSWFVLVNESGVVPESLWVRDGHLFEGESKTEAKPFRAADFVLFSLDQTAERDDHELLPFNPLWRRALEEAARPTDTSWASAKANMATLYESLLLSPDLTESQAYELADSYQDKMVKARKGALKGARLGPTEPTALAAARERAVKILEL